jgi:hypothetical protein
LLRCHRCSRSKLFHIFVQTHAKEISHATGVPESMLVVEADRSL